MDRRRLGFWIVGGVLALGFTTGGCSMGKNDTGDAQARTGRVLGIGGVFFRSDDGAAIQKWYEEHLGFPVGEQGYTVLPWRHHKSGDLGSTTWSPFPRDSTYFDPEQQYMINYIVDDLDAVRARLKEGGARIDDKVEDFEYGRFGWFWDPDGVKVELWQPNNEFLEKAYKEGSWD